MSKHYIRLDDKNRIIKGFSDDFEQALESDICINEDGGRHFELNKAINPLLINLQRIYLYKYENGEVMQRSEEEIQRDISSIPLEPSQTDLVMLAIAELANTLLGGN